MVITYVYPIVSARAITLIPEFLKAAECKNIYFNYFYLFLVGKLDE